VVDEEEGRLMYGYASGYGGIGAVVTGSDDSAGRSVNAQFLALKARKAALEKILAASPAAPAASVEASTARVELASVNAQINAMISGGGAVAAKLRELDKSISTFAVSQAEAARKEEAAARRAKTATKVVAGVGLLLVGRWAWNRWFV
jgi:hypothetical protein